jgi:cytochrome c5
LRDQNQQIFDSFMLVAGVIIGVVVGLIFFVQMSVIETQSQFSLDDPDVQAAIESNIQPVGQLVLLGSAELAAAAAPAVVAPERVATVLTGPQVYNEACVVCHAPPGISGAPVIGDGAAWTDRVTQGMDTLTDHVLNGYQGAMGFMPQKGGRTDLSDAEIIAALEYMLEQLGD